MLIQEHTVMSAAEIEINTRSYIEALFFAACDFEDFVVRLVSDIVNLLPLLVDNRHFTLLLRRFQYAFRTDTWARCPSYHGYAQEADRDRDQGSRCLQR